MIIEKQILNAANILFKDDPFSPGLILRKNQDMIEAYASNRYYIIKVTAGTFPHEDYPILPDESFDYSEINDWCVEIPKDAVEQIKKIQKKHYMPILNSIFISEVYDAEKEEGFALATDLQSTSKIKFVCKNGDENFNTINNWIYTREDMNSDRSTANFNPLYMIDLIKCICDIFGINKKEWKGVKITIGENEFSPMRFDAEKDGVRVEAYLMPVVM